MNSATLAQKLWNYCNGPELGRSLARSPAREHARARVKPRLTLRDDGMSYGDYPRLRGDRLPQLAYLLFLKACPGLDPGMADERSRPPYHQPSPIPAPYAWPMLLAKDGDALFDQFLGSRSPALAAKPSPRLLPRAFVGIEVHRTSIFIRVTHHTQEELGKQPGTLVLIFGKARNTLHAVCTPS